jgi:RHS repeat-associated protein
VRPGGFRGSSEAVEYSGGTTWFFHADHLGSPKVKTAVNGTEAERWDYYPYGETWVPGAPGDQHRYTGHLRDAESGNDFAGARYYSSARGRWLAVDPVPGDRDPQDLNRYAYVRNDPVNRLDSDGRQWVLVNCGAEVRLTGEGTVGVVRNPAVQIICQAVWVNPQRTVFENREIGPRLLEWGFLDREAFDQCFERFKGLLPEQVPDRVGDLLFRNMRLARMLGAAALTSSGAALASVATFVNLVRPEGAWDYKKGDSGLQDFGNFHFGAVAGALLLPELVARWGAGLVNYIESHLKGYYQEDFGTPLSGAPFGDDDRDQAWIVQGYEFYRGILDCVTAPGGAP